MSVCLCQVNSFHVFSFHAAYENEDHVIPILKFLVSFIVSLIICRVCFVNFNEFYRALVGVSAFITLFIWL